MATKTARTAVTNAAALASKKKAGEGSADSPAPSTPAATTPRPATAGSPAPTTPRPAGAQSYASGQYSPVPGSYSPAGAAGYTPPPGWSQPSMIPIDPSLQNTAAYPRTGYQPYPQTGPYQPMPYNYAASQPASTSSATSTPGRAPAPAPTPVASSSSGGGGGGGGSGGAGDMHTADVATLNDALGLSGVDLRAEEEAMHRTQEFTSSRFTEDRSRKQTFLDPQILAQAVKPIATAHNVSIPDESATYLALALRARMLGLITSMVSASAHRHASSVTASTSTPIPFYSDGTTPMWDLVVRRDVGKQLLALEKAEKEDEMRIRRERAALTASHANPGGTPGATGASGAQADGDDDDDEDGPKKKKKKKADGPGVTARNMSEDVRKKMSDAVAMQAAGATKYAWMTSGSSTPSKPAAKKPAAAGTPGGPATPTAGAAGGGGGWARAFVPTKQPGKDKEKDAKDTKVEDTRRQVSLRDAMFVVERERGHGGGRGSARGWT